MSEAVKKKCPDCGKPKLRRLFGTGAAVVFKGSGFYQTDYRSDSYKKAAEKDQPATESKSDAQSKSEATSKSSDGASAAKGGKSGSKPAKND